MFGYPGGAIMPVYDALPGSSLTHILVRHEQAAAFGADAWARATGEVGVCLATSGPGATNLVTGLANAYLDSVPVIAITGQVATTAMGSDAFQEVDILGMTLAVVKHSWSVRDPADIPHVVAEAFRVARSGRPGPVLIDLPKDVAAALIDPPAQESRTPPEPEPFDPATLRAAEAAIAAARKPLLYVGGGVGISGAVEPLRAFAERTGIPSVATLKGLGALPTDHPQHLGMLGMHGGRAANEAVQACDLLIVCGARFDDRATGDLKRFAPHARVVHFDADPAEIGKVREAHVAVIGSLAHVLTALDPGPLAIDEWVASTADAKARHAARYDAPGDGVFAPALLKELSETAGDRFVAACDVGQHQMWAASTAASRGPRRTSPPPGWARWAMACPPGSPPSWPARRTRSWSSPATARS